MSELFAFKQLQRTLDNKRIIKQSATLTAGQNLAVQGPSGSGKSTLLKLLARLLPAENGEVFLAGRSWTEYSPQEWRVKVHYFPQQPVLFAGSVLNNLQMPFTLKQVQQSCSFDLKQAYTMLDKLGLSRSIMEQEARTLSGGEAFRLALIRSLLIQPMVLLLDEPTAHLDEDSAVFMLNLLNCWVGAKNERAIIIVSHSADDLKALNNISRLYLSNLEDDKHE
ncbi:ybbl abc transporter atp-binding protein [hydrocarbon metagenome]|uniref:Ybbl abc transporter atp-binding protein n=1 Tax=hydrocarbon metagenome TaxID=938273 RepID=A0A0W8E3J5_9ZZZZ